MGAYRSCSFPLACQVGQVQSPFLRLVADNLSLNLKTTQYLRYPSLTQMTTRTLFSPGNPTHKLQVLRLQRGGLMDSVASKSLLL